MQVSSFKVRGAFNFLANMSEDARRAGVICASAGNHAQGVAMAAPGATMQMTPVSTAREPLMDVRHCWVMCPG